MERSRYEHAVSKDQSEKECTVVPEMQSDKSTKGLSLDCQKDAQIASNMKDMSVRKNDDDKQKEEVNQQRVQRQFMTRWQIGRPWLKHEKGKMWCQLCRDHDKNLPFLAQIRRNMIDGCSLFKYETITIHEKSKVHKHAVMINKNTNVTPQDAPAEKLQISLNQKVVKILGTMFRNVHALVKKNKGLTDFEWMCELDEIKGVDIGKKYRNRKKAREFVSFIASDSRQNMTQMLKESSYISMTCDGSTDSSIVEQEIIFVRYCDTDSC